MDLIYNNYIYFILFSLCLIIVIQYFKYKKIKKEYILLKSNITYKKNFLDIIDVLEKSIDKLLLIYHGNDIIKHNLVTQDYLSTKDYIKINKEIITTFLSIYPKEEIDFYNKVLNNNLIPMLGKIIHKKLLMLDSDLKISLKKIIRNNNEGENNGKYY